MKVAVRKKVASMMAVHCELIDAKTSIEDFGLDSLVIFTFRNWIFQNFRVDLNVGAISSAESIEDLAAGILALTPIKSFSGQEYEKAVEPTWSKTSRKDQLPKQPLPTL